MIVHGYNGVSAAKVGLFENSRAVVGLASVYQQDQEIYGEGEPAMRAYKVLRGVVRTYKLLDDGRRQVAAFYFPNDVFGLDLVETYGSTAEAVVTSQVASFQRQQIADAASRSIEVAHQLWTCTARNLDRAESHLLLLGRKTAAERVEAFLDEMNQRGRQTGRVHLSMSRRDIADYLGLTVETVSRVLHSMKDQGRLTLSGARSISLRAIGQSHCEPMGMALATTGRQGA